MATPLVPTTDLEAVNQMLATIMEAPINTLVGVTSLDAQRAISILDEVSRAVQAPGHHFNREYNYPLAAHPTTGEVLIPANCSSVDSFGEDFGRDLVQRGNRLYDRTNHTYSIGKTIKADVTFLLPFNELPEVARRYISVRACRLFQKRMAGSTTLDAFTQEDEAYARLDFIRSLTRTEDPNLFDNPGMLMLLRRR